MSIEDFDNLLQARAVSDPRTCHAFPDEPVAAEECRWSAIQRVPEHGALLDGPLGQYGEAAAKLAAEVELAIRQDAACFPPDGAVVFLRPQLLESDYRGTGLYYGDLASTADGKRSVRYIYVAPGS